MLINNLLYANPNISFNPVCVLKLLISSCSSFQSQKCVSIPLSISWKLPHAPKGSPVPLICLNYSHCAAVRQVSPKHPRKRIWCFQCQMNVRPEWKQHKRFSLTYLIKKWTLQPSFLKVPYLGTQFSWISVWARNINATKNRDSALILKALYPGKGLQTMRDKRRCCCSSLI